DRRTAYEFAVNPAGVKSDRYWFNDTNNDDSWDAVWDVSVSRDAGGWSAEFRIPFSQLRFATGESKTFGFAVVREIARVKETSTWPLLSKKATGFVSSFGDLGGLSVVASPKKLELMPYSVGSVTTQPTDGNPLLKSAAPGGALGLDVTYALTSGLTPPATVTPAALMQAVPGRTDARIQSGSFLSAATVEPMTSYSVGRVRREFANQSSIGVMLTETKRETRDSVLDVLPSNATAGGVDWDLRFK